MQLYNFHTGIGYLTPQMQLCLLRRWKNSRKSFLCNLFSRTVHLTARVWPVPTNFPPNKTWYFNLLLLRICKAKSNSYFDVWVYVVHKCHTHTQGENARLACFNQERKSVWIQRIWPRREEEGERESEAISENYKCPNHASSSTSILYYNRMFTSLLHDLPL